MFLSRILSNIRRPSPHSHAFQPVDYLIEHQKRKATVSTIQVPLYPVRATSNSPRNPKEQQNAHNQQIYFDHHPWTLLLPWPFLPSTNPSNEYWVWWGYCYDLRGMGGTDGLGKKGEVLRAFVSWIVI